MPIKILGDLSANDVHVDEVFLRESEGTIDLRGAGNVLKIETSKRCRKVFMLLRDASSCVVRRGVSAVILNLVVHYGSQIEIGENTIAHGRIKLQSHERGSITIGRDCLFASDFECYTSDMHSVVDLASGKRINPPGDVVVGDRVWAGFDVTLLKGSMVGGGSVIGARSTVNGQFPDNSLIAGYPAKLVRAGVSWAGKLLPLQAEPR